MNFLYPSPLQATGNSKLKVLCDNPVNDKKKFYELILFLPVPTEVLTLGGRLSVSTLSVLSLSPNMGCRERFKGLSFVRYSQFLSTMKVSIL
jgi:hypothetical protein